jgi:hypothetical protein
MFTDKHVKVFKNDSRKTKVGVKNVEPISNIEVVKDESDSDSVSSDSESALSEISKYNSKKQSTSNKKSKKPSNFDGRENRNVQQDFSAFSNPKKINKTVIEDSGESEYSTESESDYQDSENSGGSVDSEEAQKAKWEEKQKIKQDILIKIQALEKKGFEFSKKFTMASNFDDMKFEYEKVKHFIESQAAIKFSRRCLMACVTGIEFLNKRFDPFNVKLEGWSENVMENVNDYDNIFERLHEKYSGKAEIAPEIELLLTLGGSAFMFHLTNSLLKGPGFGGVNTVGQNNPNFMQNIIGSMNQNMNQMNQVRSTSQINQMYQQQGPPKPVETRGMKGEMRGPSIDPNLFAGTQLMNNYPKPPAPVEYSSGINEDDRFSVASSDSSLSSVSSDSDTKSVGIVKKGGRGRITKKGGGGGFELNIK